MGRGQHAWVGSEHDQPGGGSKGAGLERSGVEPKDTRGGVGHKERNVGVGKGAWAWS